ncbi:phosphate-starvation-inducible protein PsiE [Viridibacillus arvi]|uniref:phosphate-starvation-inducible protein PsiE n=1 Tax=Viridibacillus arvi TaxID=263475 RepID=UPI0034CF066D
MINFQNKTKSFLDFVTMFVQIVLNTTLAFLAVIITCLLIKELIGFAELVNSDQVNQYHIFLERILVFFIYFEFISMIVKYFKESYHFPMRYFLYIGITAMVRLVIVDHEEAEKTLMYAFVILILIISYFILNFTPRERPEKYTIQKK